MISQSDKKERIKFNPQSQQVLAIGLNLGQTNGFNNFSVA